MIPLASCSVAAATRSVMVAFAGAVRFRTADFDAGVTDTAEDTATLDLGGTIFVVLTKAIRISAFWGLFDITGGYRKDYTARLEALIGLAGRKCLNCKHNGTKRPSSGYIFMERSKNRPITILLVEDEIIIRMSSAAILEDAGFGVLEASNADTALAALAAHPEIDVVVTDVQMPGSMDGLQLVEMIAQNYPHVYTLVTSGRTNRDQACRSGATKYLSKPYTAAAIQSAVASTFVS